MIQELALASATAHLGQLKNLTIVDYGCDFLTDLDELLLLLNSNPSIIMCILQKNWYLGGLMSQQGPQVMDAQAIGELFRQKRKELNLSLKEVENATSVRMTYLQAIEDGQMEKLISPIYAQGFVRQYAAFVGLDGDKLVTEHADIFRKPISQEFAYGIGTLETRGGPGGGVKWIPNAFWILGMGFVAIIAYFVAKSLELF